MFDHVAIIASDPIKGLELYLAALKPLGITLQTTLPEEYTGGKKVHGLGYPSERPEFWISEGKGHEKVHIAFTAESRSQVDQFYAAAIQAGGRDNGAPGLRPMYGPNYYGAFFLDHDGNNIEAICRKPE
eukprot:TRINITY_DN19275_c0_g1_i1.p3 TRINITY_DN19275_c0_g1~~TRINITY_DN19275_c0_g1_i1.p3  ORF type:complete len:129 (-),score=25.82 TRINITY_DN19275_c0_g1_i1:74-460(-)